MDRGTRVGQHLGRLLDRRDPGRVDGRVKAGPPQHANAQPCHTAVQPGRPVSRIVRQAIRVPRIEPRQRAQGQRRIPHRARQRPGYRYVTERAQRPLRHPAKARFISHHPAPRRRYPNAAARVRTQMDRSKPGRTRRCRTAARPARARGHIPRVARNAVQRAVARRLPAEFRRGRFAKQYGPLLQQTHHGRRVLGGRRRGRGPAAAPGRQAGDVDQILDRDRHTIQRAQRPAGHPAPLTLHRLLRRPRVQHGKRVDARVVPGHPLCHGLQYLNRTECSAGICARKAASVEQGRVQPPVRLMCRATAGAAPRRSITKSWPSGFCPIAARIASSSAASSAPARSTRRRSA